MKANYIFFIRGPADADFNLPLINSLNNTYLYNLGTIPVKGKLLKLLLKSSKSLFSNSRFIEIYFRYKRKIISPLRYFIDGFITRKIIKDLAPIFKEKSIPNFFIYDHTNSDKILFLKSVIKRLSKSSVKFISLPHGINMFENKMIDITDLDPSKSFNISYCDDTQIICHEIWQQKKILNPSSVIYHPRYTKKWLSILQKQLNFKNSINSTKLKVLVIHSKFCGNINSNEFLRVIKILLNNNSLDITINIHPRSSLKEKNIIRSLSRKILITKDYLPNLIMNNDLIIFFQSSAIIDAFILGKYVILPSFCTTNKIKDEIYNYCNVASSPDEFYYLISNINKYNYYKILKKKKYFTPSFSDQMSNYLSAINK